MATRPSVLIVGGGIGGLACALALARAGCTVRVLERAPKFAEVGAGIQLAPNATRILAKLGVMDAVDRTAVYPDELVLRSAKSGAALISLDLGADFRSRYGAPYIVIHRHDLLQALLEGCLEHESIALETDRDVVDVEDLGQAVRVLCADGAAYDTELLIGADGLRSRVRTLIADDQLVPTPLVAYRSTVPFGAIATHDETEHSVVGWIGPGIDFVRYPLRRGEICNLVAVFESDAYDPTQDWGEPKELDRRFASTCDAVQEGVALLERERRWYLADREPLDRWSRNRIVLLGDAAHPMWQYLAQGGCQALEDADALAESLGDGIDDAIQEYQRTRIPRTTQLQRTARSWGQLWHLAGVGAAVRDELFRTIAPTAYERVDWLYQPSAVTRLR